MVPLEKLKGVSSPLENVVFLGVPLVSSGFLPGQFFSGFGPPKMGCVLFLLDLDPPNWGLFCFEGFGPFLGLIQGQPQGKPSLGVWVFL